jgi:long-chain fatty acid transport protein
LEVIDMRRIAFVFLAVLLALPAFAQNTDIEALAGLNFHFGNPGARALGMGGAFLGLADDASAAEANPAGLTILRKPEISIEGRNWLSIQRFNVSGTFPDLESNTFNSYSDRAPVTFASVVMPVGNRFSVAAYYHAPLDQEDDIFNIFGQTDLRGNFFLDPINFYLGPQGPVNLQQCINLGDQCLEYTVLPFFTSVNVKLKTWGLAGAWQMGRLSLGVAARYHQFEEFAATLRTDTDLNLQNVVSQQADDSDVTFSAGFKYALSDRFSIGGVYKQGAEFETELRYQDLGTGGNSVVIGAPPFSVPDTYGVGISFRPIQALTINVDAIQVQYSQLANRFETVLDLTPAEIPGFEIDDVLEIHAGAEYFFSTRIPFAVRGGWWREPAHRLEYRGDLRSPAQVAARILYPEGQDQDHYTVGLGLAWPNFQIDAAYDTSDTFKVGSLSAVFRF